MCTKVSESIVIANFANWQQLGGRTIAIVIQNLQWLSKLLYYRELGHAEHHKYTVKPPKKGRIGDGPFVPSREVVLFWRFSILRVNVRYWLHL